MDLEALRTFIAVVDAGSLLGGAEQLNASRATVRRRLEELEATAGSPLLSRGARGVVPTAAGEILARRGRLILAEAEVLLDAVQSLGREPTGTLRITAPVGMPPQTMAMMTGLLRSRWPRLHCELRFSERPLDSLLAGTDLALSLDRSRPEGPYDCIELPPVRERLMASVQYLKRSGPITGLDDLARHPLLLWRSPEGETKVLPLLDGGQLRVRPVVITPDPHLLRLMAAAGAGVAYVPDARLTEPPGEVLVPVLDHLVGSQRPVRVVVPTALSELPKVKVVLDLLRSLLGAPA